MRDLIINSFVQKEQKIKIPFSFRGFLQRTFVILLGGISRDMWGILQWIYRVEQKGPTVIQLAIIPVITNNEKNEF